MVTKGIVEEIINDYQVLIRLPIYNGIEGTKQSTPKNELNKATICTLSNLIRPVAIGDIVYVGFEDNDMGKPVVIGHLYKEIKSSNLSDFNLNSSNINNLKINNSADLPSNTNIGNIKNTEIAALSDIETNIQEQLNSKINTKDIFNLIYPIGSIYTSVNDINPNTLFNGEWDKIEDLSTSNNLILYRWQRIS